MLLVYVTHYAEVTFLNNQPQNKNRFALPTNSTYTYRKFSNTMNRLKASLSLTLFLKLVTPAELVLELDQAQKQGKLKPGDDNIRNGVALC